MPIAIVTGGNSGIGRATCVLLAERGFDIGLTFHADEEQAREAAGECAEHGVRTAVRQMDLEADVGQADAVESLAAELGGVDVFVNTAGGAHAAPVLELSLDAWRRSMPVVRASSWVRAAPACGSLQATAPRRAMVPLSAPRPLARRCG